MALSFCCGAECQVNGAGANVPTGTVKHWQTLEAAVTNVSTTVRTGTYSWQHNPSAATAQLRHVTAAVATYYGRAYVRFSTLPNGSTVIAGCTSITGSVRLGVAYNSVTGKLTAGHGTTYNSDGPTAATGQWYLLEWKVYVGATTFTCDVKVDGSPLNQITSSGTATNISDIFVGNVTSRTMTMFSDDIAGSETDWIGGGEVYGLVPDADGTHSFEDGDFIWDAAGANVPTNSTTTYTYVNTALDTTIGNFLNHAASEASSPDYVAWTLPSLPVSPSAVNGVEVVAAYHSFGTGANNIGMKMHDGTNTADVHGLIDISETTILIPSWHKSTAPDGGAWTEADVNALQLRWGYSTDANPDAYIDGVRVEVDVQPATGDANPPQTAIALTTTLDQVTVTVEATPVAAALTTTTDQSTTGVGANPDTILAPAALDQATIATEAIPTAAALTVVVDRPLVSVEATPTDISLPTVAPQAVPDIGVIPAAAPIVAAVDATAASVQVAVEAAAQILATLDQVTAAETVERIPDPVAVPVALDPGPVGIEVVPAAAVATATLDSTTASVEATPGATLAVGSLPTVGVNTLRLQDGFVVLLEDDTRLRLEGGELTEPITSVDPDAIFLRAFADEFTVGIEATPGAFVALATLDQVTAEEVGGGDADVTPDPLICSAFIDQPTASVEATPGAATVTVALDQAATGVEATPDAISVVVAVGQATVGVAAAPGAIASTTALDLGTVAVEASPATIGAVAGLDAPSVESGVTAGIDLESADAMLLESGSVLLLQAGEWTTNVTPDAVAVTAYVPLCQPTSAGRTISQPFAYEPYAFSGLAGHIAVTATAFSATTFLSRPTAGVEAAPNPATLTVEFTTPIVQTGGSGDENVNPSAFGVGLLDPQAMPTGAVSVGASPDPVAGITSADTPSAGVGADVTPDPFVVRFPGSNTLLESDAILLTEDGGHLNLEEGGIVPTVDSGEVGGVTVAPAAVDVVCGIDVWVGQEFSPDAILVLADATTPNAQVGPPPAPGRRRPTRRAILVLRGTGKSRLVVRS